jgi:hypothetical protein
MGDYDDEPTVIFRKGELPSAFDLGPGRGDREKRYES